VTDTATTRPVDPSLVSYTHWMYALHALAAVIGISTPLILLLGLGLLIMWFGIALVGLWILYRVVRGWLALKDGRPV
jgi:uncharacterized membrane protein